MKNAIRKSTGAIRNLGQWRPIEDAKPGTWVLVPWDGNECGVTMMRAEIAQDHWPQVKYFVPVPTPPKQEQR